MAALQHRRLHPVAHPMTAVMLRDMRKGTPVFTTGFEISNEVLSRSYRKYHTISLLSNPHTKEISGIKVSLCTQIIWGSGGITPPIPNFSTRWR
jgi:hypothetical protein